MPFVKPHTYVAGTILDASAHTSNEEALKLYVNQEVVAADILDGTLIHTDLEQGSYNPINNHHSFITGEIYGRNAGKDVTSRAYYTDHLKHNQGSVVFTTIADTGDELVLKETGTVMLSFGGAFVSLANFIKDQDRWPSKVVLRYDGGSGWVNIGGTRAFTFEETGASANGGAGRTVQPTISAGEVAGTPNSVKETNIARFSLRRWIGWSWMITDLPAGSYKFAVCIDAEVEQGFVEARSFTTEIFY